MSTISRRALLSGSLVAGLGAATAPVAFAAAAPAPGTPATADVGSLQSPIDLRPSEIRRVRGLPELKVCYDQDAAVSLQYRRKDEGDPAGCSARGIEETEQVNVEPGAAWATYEGVRYDLTQFHFHTPSEHTVEGRHAPLEQHVVHTSADGAVIVIGTLLFPGRANEADRVLSNLPAECDGGVEIDDFDLRALLPANLSTARYTGSLTTAPYTEGVRWFLTAPRTVSPEGIANFQALFPGGDFRESQPLDGRTPVADPQWRH